jgi:hypothetical protein
MRRSTLYAALATTALTLGGTAAVTAPAHATTPTTVSLDLSGHTHVKGVYGDYLGSLGGSVSYTQTDGTAAEAYQGTAQLERRWAGSPTWTVVAQDTDPGYLYFGKTGTKAKRNVQYRVHYLGGTGTDAAGNPIVWDPAYSGVVTVGVGHKLSISGTCNPKCHFSGKVSPSYKHKPVLVQVKHGSWTKYKVVKTDRHARFRADVTATRGKGTAYRLVVKGSKKFLKVVSAPYRAVHY